MDVARDKVTGDLVEAEQLWLLTFVDKDRYVCPGLDCGRKVSPASFLPTNLKRPYFSATSGHEDGCDIAGTERLIAAARRGSIANPLTGFPAPYPSRLVLRDVRDVVGPGGEEPEVAKTSPRERRDADGDHSGAVRTRDAGTIRPICRAFINFPFDRYLALSVPGVEARTYRDCFKRLKWDSLELYPSQRIFYAAMRWSKPFETEQFIEVSLDAGPRNQGKLIEGHRLRIHWAGWSKAKRTYVRNELEVARKAAIEAKGKEKAFLFFLGQQDVANPYQFNVDDHRLLCCLVDDIIYPPA